MNCLPDTGCDLIPAWKAFPLTGRFHLRLGTKGHPQRTRKTQHTDLQVMKPNSPAFFLLWRRDLLKTESNWVAHETGNFLRSSCFSPSPPSTAGIPGVCPRHSLPLPAVLSHTLPASRARLALYKEEIEDQKGMVTCQSLQTGEDQN